MLRGGLFGSIGHGARHLTALQGRFNISLPPDPPTSNIPGGFLAAPIIADELNRLKAVLACSVPFTERAEEKCRFFIERAQQSFKTKWNYISFIDDEYENFKFEIPFPKYVFDGAEIERVSLIGATALGLYPGLSVLGATRCSPSMSLWLFWMPPRYPHSWLATCQWLTGIGLEVCKEPARQRPLPDSLLRRGSHRQQ